MNEMIKSIKHGFGGYSIRGARLDFQNAWSCLQSYMVKDLIPLLTSMDIMHIYYAPT